ncbi:FAD-dependent thymidylate synthase [Streptomyces sp. H34-S4]|uniref:FAD-dependent thymidylate synthase n=1 Tax=Streptomyces sp. H34-S4 TaxID=2996463 RepID=UPI002270D271|nr:FAD-dependent thymidylate synthase [Streptomyces sp. H34-S4]MCY0933672.1 FAD-dependent thymidylate synthase [Streptomyces sp. H34-S4]
MTALQFRSDVTVDLVKHNAKDFDVAMAARVSTIGGSHDETVDLTRDHGLINFLMRDRHGSPFEHNSFTFYIEAPIFVAREFFRHRAGWSYNEQSGRYKELDPVFYVPPRDRDLIQVGRPGAYTFEPGTYDHFGITRWEHEQTYRITWTSYQRMLREGIAKEVARNVLPVGIFTSFYATCNARSLMHFLSLRTMREGSKFPSFPQREIELVAEDMEGIFEERMPITHAAFLRNGRVAP